MLNREQYKAVRAAVDANMDKDPNGEYLVQNLYYDTDNWDIIRHSIEKPVFKEKLRLRCYGVPQNGSDLFLEIKKKHEGIVYKRRIKFPVEAFANMELHDIVKENHSQIGREMNFYLNAHSVRARVFVSYHRAAFVGQSGLRITFDTDSHFREDELSLGCPNQGEEIFPQDMVLMELKTNKSIPMWMVNILSEKKIRPISFSKYGTGYKKYILGA